MKLKVVSYTMIGVFVSALLATLVGSASLLLSH